jgi:hypothetical protein
MDIEYIVCFQPTYYRGAGNSKAFIDFAQIPLNRKKVINLKMIEEIFQFI